MLVQFSLKNYKTFKAEAKLSMVASNYDKTTRYEENVVEVPAFGLKLLKSAVIYGANASGKSKLMEGMNFMKKFVIQSSKETQKGDPINVQSFLLSTETENEPSEFEVIFVHEAELFRYGFAVLPDRVTAEWLFHRAKTKEVEIFYREGQKFELHDRRFVAARSLVAGKMIRNNALLISVAAQFNDRLAGRVLDWFRKFNVISGLREEGYQGFTMAKTKENDTKAEIIHFIKNADLGIEDLTLQLMDLDNIPANIPKELRDLLEQALREEGKEVFMDVLTTHLKYNEWNRVDGSIQFSMEKDESSGTRKFFALSGPVLETLRDGDILVGDELDSKLHPNLMCKLVELFNSRENNPSNGQLIFNTHDTNLLSSGLFRRDQIWFTEKDRYGAATLYSLGDFKTDEVRKGDNFEERYIQGKYGAIPYLGDFSKLFPVKPKPAPVP